MTVKAWIVPLVGFCIGGCEPRPSGGNEELLLADSVYYLCEAEYWKHGLAGIEVQKIRNRLPVQARKYMEKRMGLERIEVVPRGESLDLVLVFAYSISKTQGTVTYSIPGVRGESPGPVYEPVSSAKGFVERGELVPDRLNYADFIARRYAYTSSMAAVDEWNTKRSKDGLVKVNSFADGAFEVFIDGKFIALYRYHEGGLRYECLSVDLFL